MVVLFLAFLSAIAHAGDIDRVPKTGYPALVVNIRNVGEPTYNPYRVRIFIECGQGKNNRHIHPVNIQQADPEVQACEYGRTDFDPQSKDITLNYTIAEALPRGQTVCTDGRGVDLNLNDLKARHCGRK